jgi:choice-of-anchor C domain-containing protein
MAENKNMAKIIKSLVIVIAVTAIAGYGTYSFFSDTETSTGNTFMAGEIDLQVDSQSHYNGMVCEDGKWVAEPNCKVTGNNLLNNESFETGTDPGSFATLNSGSNDITPWTVDSGSIDYIGSYWQASDGGRSIDMNGFVPGSVSQTLSTVAGDTYQVTFDLSGNPESRSDPNDPYYSPSNKVLAVSATDTSPINFNYDTGFEQNTLANMKWKKYSYSFTATGTSTTLTFASQISGAFGPAVDNIDVHKTICEPLPSPEFLGDDCDGTWILTDLGPTNQFFNFEDIKPGDQGENTVSLHVDDNDAYACLMIHNVKNDEHDLIDPEGKVGDVTNDPNGGELDENLNFFSWSDDGDNIWEENEPPLFNPIVGSGEALLNGKVYPLYLPPNPFPANTTKYIGIAWCVGTMNVNQGDHSIECDGTTVDDDAQTDSFTADLTFYVEQARNNSGFVCPPVPVNHL